MRKGIEIGEARGLARGKEEQARQTAINLHLLGIDTDKIAQAVGFGIDTVKQGIAAAQKA